VYRKSQSDQTRLLIAAVPIAVIMIVILFTQLDAPARTLAQQNATQPPAVTPSPTVNAMPALAQDVEMYASVAHALQAQAVVDEDPFLAYRLAVEAGRGANPPAEAYAALLSMVYDSSTLREFDATIGLEALALSEDGRTAAALNMANQLIVWDVVSGAILNTFAAPRGYIDSAAFSADGTQLVATMPDNQLLVRWEVMTGRASRIAVRGIYGVVAVSPDKRRALMSQLYVGTLTLWDFETQEPVLTLPAYPTAYPTEIKFSPDGNMALVGYSSGLASLWDLTTGNLLREMVSGTSPVYALAFSPSGNTAAVGLDDGTLSIWSVATGNLLYQLQASSSGILDVTFSPNGFYVTTASGSGEVALWDLEVGAAAQRFAAHQRPVNQLAFSADGHTLLSADTSGRVLSWSLGTYENLGIFFGHENAISTVAFSPDGQYALTAAVSETDFLLWNVSNRIVLRTFSGHTAHINSAAFSPDGRTIVSGSADTNAILWDVLTGEQIRILENAGSWLGDVEFSSDGRRVIGATDVLGVVMWDVDPESQTFGDILQRFNDFDSGLSEAAYSPDGSRVAAGGNRGVRVWDAATGEVVRQIDSTDPILTLAFSPDGRFLASGFQNGAIMVWDIASGAMVSAMAGHSSHANHLTFSPDGRTLLSGGSDRLIILWDVATGQRIRVYEGHSGNVNSVAFSADGRFALSGAADASVRLWSIPPIPELINILLTERYAPELTCEQRRVFRVLPSCDGMNSVPDSAAYPTLTPAPTLADLFPSRTPAATNTPAPTPISAGTAQVGDNRGEIAIGGAETWIYNGGYGETLTIRVMADHPANDAEDRAGLLDTYLTVYTPNGDILYLADDIVPGRQTDSLIEDLILGSIGEYRIVVSSWNNESGGAYTLVIQSTPYVPTPTFTPSPTGTPAG
jgi:WD40 repeat protein